MERLDLVRGNETDQKGEKIEVYNGKLGKHRMLDLVEKD